MSSIHQVRIINPSRSVSSSAPRSAAWNAAVGSAKVQSYVSTIHDPYINLGIENYLFRKTPHESCVLFLYRNNPCVVIGRNQNPWLELNLPECLERARREELSIVRRYSGGGTVFHDLGNVNWTVISPPDTFTRDKHAEMVVRALRRRGIERARVNERHDIVLDQSLQKTNDSDPNDTHRTPYTMPDGSNTRKCSGSAYKLTRGRALHHGTCLLNSPNLSNLRQLLHSPARNHISAKGVESVSSPVSNTFVTYEDFASAVAEEFRTIYTFTGDRLESVEVGQNAIMEHTVRQSHDEMKTDAWTFGQTPRFTFRLQKQDEHAVVQYDVQINARHAQIEEFIINQRERQPQISSLYGSHSWGDMIASSGNAIGASEMRRLAEQLDTLLPIAMQA
ncbi:MAG: hypothetical protein Q9162_001706 [Coniocarpon cinnabarinum]